MTDGPWHPREPSPLEIALRFADPFNWARLGFAVSVWAVHQVGRGFTRKVR